MELKRDFSEYQSTQRKPTNPHFTNYSTLINISLTLYSLDIDSVVRQPALKKLKIITNTAKGRL
jgi:hypothetical protein